MSPTLMLALLDAGIKVWAKIAEVKMRAEDGDMTEAEALAALRAIQIKDTDDLLAGGDEEEP